MTRKTLISEKGNTKYLNVSNIEKNQRRGLIGRRIECGWISMDFYKRDPYRPVQASYIDNIVTGTCMFGFSVSTSTVITTVKFYEFIFPFSFSRYLLVLFSSSRRGGIRWKMVNPRRSTPSPRYCPFLSFPIDFLSIRIVFP